MIKCPKYKRLYVEYTTLYIDILKSARVHDLPNVHVRHTTVPAISLVFFSWLNIDRETLRKKYGDNLNLKRFN